MYDRSLARTSEMLRWTYGLMPIAAGADKFTNLLTDWPKYLSPAAARRLPMSPRSFMRIVGLVEVAAGALVLNRRTARLGAYVVGGWLGAIAINLVSRRAFDIAVRDLAMGIGALALGRMLTARARLERLAGAERDHARERERERLHRERREPAADPMIDFPAYP